jgi:hypothetical protein
MVDSDGEELSSAAVLFVWTGVNRPVVFGWDAESGSAVWVIARERTSRELRKDAWRWESRLEWAESSDERRV